jgi:hypothetical protein
MQSSLSYYISSDRHHHKVCGMHPSLLAAMRQCKADSRFDTLCNMVSERTQQLVGQEQNPSVGVIITPVIGKPLHATPFDLDADIIIALIPDPVWIDCKQATIIKVGSAFDNAKVEGGLYKMSVDATCLESTEGACSTMESDNGAADLVNLTGGGSTQGNLGLSVLSGT